MFYKFIWNGGNDRVKRNYLLNDYSDGGLRMVDMVAFSQAQKLVWAKNMLDPNYSNFWKHLENSTLSQFCNDPSLLWKSNAPDSVLNSLNNTQLAETLRVWYTYRDKIKENLGFENYHLQDVIWWNRNIRLKTKRFFFYPEWFNLGISTVDDLYRGFNFVKSFEDLVIEFDISIRDRRKYNSLMKGISFDWFYNPADVQDNIFEEIVQSMFGPSKITKHSYNILKTNVSPINTELYWMEILNVDGDEIEWGRVHDNNFHCTIETQLRSFYFKIFHKAICTNKFLHKIGRSDSPSCFFCKSEDESLLHLFCECDKIKCLWDDLVIFIENKTDEQFTLTNFNKMFGLDSMDTKHSTTINFLLLCLKFYIHRCKFQQIDPNFNAFIKLAKIKFKIEYKIAEKNGKLSKPFKNFSFVSLVPS